MTSYLEQVAAGQQQKPGVTPKPGKSFLAQRQEQSVGMAQAMLGQMRSTTSAAAVEAVRLSGYSSEVADRRFDAAQLLQREGEENALALKIQTLQNKRALNQNKKLAPWITRDPVNAVMYNTHSDEIGTLRALYEGAEFTAKQYTLGLARSAYTAGAFDRLNRAERSQEDADRTFTEILLNKRNELAEQKAEIEGGEGEDPLGIPIVREFGRTLQRAYTGLEAVALPVFAGVDYLASRNPATDEEIAVLQEFATEAQLAEAETQANIETGYRRSAAAQRAQRAISDARAQYEAEGGTDPYELFTRQISATLANPADGLSFLLMTALESSGGFIVGGGIGVATRSATMGAVGMGASGGGYAFQMALPEMAREQGFDLTKREDIERFVRSPEMRNVLRDRAATYALTLAIVDTLSGKMAGTAMAKTVTGNLMLQGLTQAAMGSSGEALALMASGQEMDLFEVALEGLAEFVTVPVEVAVIGGQSLSARAHARNVREKEAQNAQVLFSVIADGAQDSELRAQLPEKYGELVSELTKDGPVATIEIDASALPEMFQSGKTTPEQVAELTGLTLEEVNRAVEEGNMLSIATALYAQNIAGSDVDAALRKHVSIRGGMTAAQLEMLDDPDWRARIEQDISEVQSGVRQVSEDVERARTQLVGELIASNERFTVEMAEAAVTPMLMFAEATASRLGTDFTGFVERFALPRFRDSLANAPVDVPVAQLRDILATPGPQSLVIQRAMDAAGLDAEATNEEIAEALIDFTQTNVGEAEGAADRMDARRILNQSSVDIMGSPLEVGKRRGRTTVWNLAEALTDRQRAEYGRELDTVNSSEDFEIAVQAMLDEFNEQHRTMNSGVEWYAQDIEDAIAATMAVIPELRDPMIRDLFIATAAILSPSEMPLPNWEKAIVAFVPYIQTGNIAATKPTFNEKGTPASFGTNATGLQLLQYMLDTRGLRGTVEFLRSVQPEAEMTKIRKDSGIFKTSFRPKEMYAGESMMGGYMFGPKVGDFMLNATGLDPDAVTVDLWLGRTYRRITGQLLNVSDKQRAAFEPAANPNNRKERDAMKAVVFEVAARTGQRPSAVQAVLWYYEQRLYREHGIDASSQNFKDAAFASAAKRGFGDAQRDDTGAGDSAVESLRQVPVTERELRPKAQAGLGLDFFQRPGWAILSADDTSLPDTHRATTNLRESGMLRAELEKRGIPYRTAKGFYGSPEPENSFIILADEATAMELGKMFRQDSVLTREGLVYTTNARPNTPWTGRLLRGQAAIDQEYYTQMDDGSVFALQLDWDRGPGKTVKPLGLTPVPDRPQLYQNEDGMTPIFHITPTEGLTETDPAKAGSGPMTSNARRQGIKATYFGTNMRREPREPGTGYVREKGLGDNVYAAEVDPQKLYPMTDPDGILSEAKGEREQLEAAMAAGYEGIYSVTSDTSKVGNVVIMGVPVSVTPIEPDAMYFPPDPEQPTAAVPERPEDAELNQAALPEGYRLPDLERSSPGPVPGVRESATAYMQNAGLPVRHQASYVKVDTTRAALIAELYDRAEDMPNDPEVRAAYEALATEVVAQYEALLELGFTFEWIVGEDPYNTPADAIRDMQENKHLYVFPTVDGYGAEGGVPNAGDNPMLRETEYEVDGRKALVNDLFRIVHDVYGHGSEGAAFGPRGEENAWQAHVRMFTPLAARAMTSETRGQNSWVNYGPFGEQNRANPRETVFADQKVTLLPEWVSNIGQASDLAVFDGQPALPKLMRSAVPQRPDDVELFQAAKAPVFHSALVKFLETAKQDKAPAKDWVSILSKAPGVKELELVWTDVYAFLQKRIEMDPNMQVTRNELLGRAQNGFTRMVPVFVEGPKRHREHVEKGGVDKYVTLLGIVDGLDTLGPNESRGADTFVQSAHFDEPNIAVHIRATHRGDTFFVEEVQSDLNTALRNAGGAPSLEALKEAALSDTTAAEAKLARVKKLDARKLEIEETMFSIRERVRRYDGRLKLALKSAVYAQAEMLGKEDIADFWESLPLRTFPKMYDLANGHAYHMPTPAGRSQDHMLWANDFTNEAGEVDAERLVTRFVLKAAMATDMLSYSNDDNEGIRKWRAEIMPDVVERVQGALDDGVPAVRRYDELARELEGIIQELNNSPVGWSSTNEDVLLPWNPLQDELAVNVAAKQALYYAVENGFKKLQWTPAVQQGRRWRKQVEQVNDAVQMVKWQDVGRDSRNIVVGLKDRPDFRMEAESQDDGTLVVAYARNYPQLVGKKVSEILGDEIADQIANEAEGLLDNPEVRFRTSSGEGYINVYDRQMRKALDKTAKAFGEKVTVGKLNNIGPGHDTQHMRRLLNEVHGRIHSDAGAASFDTLMADLRDYDPDVWDRVMVEARERTAASFGAIEAFDNLRSTALRVTLIDTMQEIVERDDGRRLRLALAKVMNTTLPSLDPTQQEDVWELPINDKMRTSILSEGFTLYQRPRNQNEAFARWIEGSVVRNMDGSPMVLYHGTRAAAEFPSFRALTHMGTSQAANDRLKSTEQMGFRVTDATDKVRVIPVYAAIKRPLPVGRERAEGLDWWDNDADMLDQVITVAQLQLNVPNGWENRAFKLLDDMRQELNSGVFDADAWAPLRERMAVLIEALGFDGISYINGFEDAGNVSYVALRPEQIKSVYNSGRWGPQDPDMLAQENRGSISLPPPGSANRAPIINMMKGSDFSTVIHEGGHWFLYVYEELVASGEASPDIVESYMALKKWWADEAEAVAVEAQKELPTATADLVIEYLNQGTTGNRDIDAAVYRAIHEFFARGFERYAREGKSPSAETRTLFARFQAWLTQLYSHARKLNVPITDEVREVFDRMLATDDEIAKAKGVTDQIEIMARNAEELGVTDAEYEDIVRLSIEAQDAAKEELLREVMRPMIEAETEERKRLRLAIEAQVAEEIAARPEHRVIQWLTNEKWIGDGQPNDLPGAEAMRFDSEMFDADYSRETRLRLPRGRRAMFTTGSAMTPDDVAGWFGFDTGAALVEAVLAAPRYADAVKAETDLRVREQIGDPLIDGTLGDKAVNAINNEKRGDLIAAELRALSKNASRNTPRTTRSALRAIARQRIAMMPARQAAQTNTYLNGMRSAATRAQQALAKKDYDAAYEAKRQELLQHGLFMESKKAAEDLRKIETKVAQLRKKSARSNIDAVYLLAIDEIMDIYDFRKSMTQAEERRRGSLAAYIQMMADEGRLNELAIPEHVLARTKKTPYRTLPMQELRGVMQSIQNIEHTGRRKKKLIDAQRQRELDAEAAKVADGILSNVKGRGPARTREGDSKLREIGRAYLDLALNADTLLREYDGWDMGDVYDALKADIDTAGSVAQRMRMEAAEAMEQLYRARYTVQETRQMARSKPVPELATRGDQKPSFAKWDLISMALNMGNEENLKRLMDRDNGWGYNQQQIDFIKSQLTDNDWDFVQSVWDYIDTYWPMIAERERRQTGVPPEKVMASEVTTATGRVLPGGYYPIVYDPRIKSTVANEQQQELLTNMMGGRFGKAQTRAGHLKERTGGSGGRVMQLGMGVFHSHIGQVIHDLAFSEAVNSSWRILQHPEVVAAFEARGRVPDKQALEVWLQDVATGPMVAGGAFGQIALRLKNNFTLSKLAFNLSTVLIQLTGITQSMVVVGHRNYAKAQVKYMARPQEWAREIIEVSPFMRERETTFNKDILDLQGDLNANPLQGRYADGQALIARWGFLLMTWVQFYGVDLPTWIAGYDTGLVKYKGDEVKARQYADRMVARAQASGLMADRTAFERGSLSQNSRQQGFIRLFTALGSYMFAKANVAYERAAKGKRDVVDAGFSVRALIAAFSTAFDLGMLFTLEAILYHLIKGTLPDDEDEDDTWAEFIARETALSVIGTMPFARDFSGPVAGFDAGGAYAAIGDTISRPAVNLMEGRSGLATAKGVTNAIGLTTGIPSSQLNRVWDGIGRTIEGEEVAPIEWIMGRRY